MFSILKWRLHGFKNQQLKPKNIFYLIILLVFFAQGVEFKDNNNLNDLRIMVSYLENSKNLTTNSAFIDDTSNLLSNNLSSLSTNVDAVLVLSENETKAETLSSFDESPFSTIILDALNKVESQSILKTNGNYEFQITEPQVYTPGEEWKSVTLGSRSISKQPVVLGPQPWPDVAPNPAIEAHLKVTSATNEAENVIAKLRECNSLQSDAEKLLELEDLMIKNSAILNEHLQKTLYDIQQVIYEPDGWIQSGSGKFVGINSTKDVATINKYIDQFEREVQLWQHDRTSIYRDVFCDYDKISPKYGASKPFNSLWHSKIKNEHYNLDLKTVSIASSQQELEQAQKIVANYEQQIPRTKDGWLKAGAEHSRFSTINQIYQRNLAKQQSIALAQIQAKTTQLKHDSLAKQAALSAIEKKEVAGAIKILSSPSDFSEFSSESLISADFIKTVKNAESQANLEYDLNIFDDACKDPELKKLLHEALEREQKLAQQKYPEPASLKKQCDSMLKQWIDEYRRIQNKVLTDDNAFRKYVILCCTELDVKTLELLQGILHPIETVEGMAHGFKTIAKFVGRLDEIEFYLERNDLETARQKSKELSDKVDAVLNNFRQLSREDKFKVAIGLLYDLVITQKLVDKSLVLAGRLKTAAQEMRAVKKAEQFAVQEGLLKIERFTEACEKNAQQIEVINRLKQLEKVDERLRNTLVEVALKKEQELLATHANLPRTVERVMKEFQARVACLSMQYGQETVKEAVSLFNTSENGLIKNVKTLDKLVEIAEGLHKVNSNPRWKKFKYDVAKSGKNTLLQDTVSIGTVEEALAGIACEEQGLLPTLVRATGEGEDFVEVVSRKCWDVKTPRSQALNGKCIFDAEEQVEALKAIFKKNPKENIIFDITLLIKDEVKKVYDEIRKQMTNDELSRMVIINRNNPSASLSTKELINVLGK